MDKVISSRIDEAVANQISLLAHELGTSKKDVIESAIRLLAQTVNEEHKVDVFERTFGLWPREDSIDESVERSRSAFSESMSRHRVGA